MADNKPIALLRKWMKANKVALFVCNNANPFLGEYVAEHWKTRAWLSGFTGSNGLLAVGLNEAALWSDSRYALLAVDELNGTGIAFVNESLPESPTLFDWIESLQIARGGVVALDGRTFSIEQTRQIESFCHRYDYELNQSARPANELWINRPPLLFNTVYRMPSEYAGRETSEKLADIHREMEKKAADGLLVTALDEVAWCFNLRGSDIDCSPLANALAYISPTEAVLFVDAAKVTSELRDYLYRQGVIIADLVKWESFIASLSKGLNIWIDPRKCNAFFDSLTTVYTKIYGPSPIELLKSVKNPVEIEGERAAMVYDGIALCRLFRWIEEQMAANIPLRETQIVNRIAEIRSALPAYMSESFTAIAGYGANGAIVHYTAKSGCDAELKAGSLLLIDTGAHYINGTTDITRTIALGKPTAEMRRDFTLVLKGHIALAAAIFPEGTRGAQLDVLARQFLWKEGLTYLHGTGHGIGHVLNVHEGPQSIRLQENPTVLQSGMLLSNEPGYYKEGCYGIRCENAMLVAEHSQTDSGRFLRFETLSLFPFDAKLIDRSLLTPDEQQWLDSYHQTVYEKLAPHLSPDECKWLRGISACHIDA